MSEKEMTIKKRNTMFGVVMWVLLGFMWFGPISYIASYWAGIGTSLFPPSAFHHSTWAIAYYIAIGMFTALTMYSRDIPRGLMDIAIPTAVLMFIAAILNIFFVVYSWSLWSRCVTGVASLDTLETVECDDDVWMIYIQAIWSLGYALFAGLGFITAGIEAFLKFDSRSAVGRLTKPLRQVGGIVVAKTQSALDLESQMGRNVYIVHDATAPQYPYQ